MKLKYVVWLYPFIIVCCFWALMVNIKTIPLVDATKDIQKEIAQLKEQNETLRYQLVKKTNYFMLQQHIKRLNLEKPDLSAVSHVVLPEKEERYDN